MQDRIGHAGFVVGQVRVFHFAGWIIQQGGRGQVDQRTFGTGSQRGIDLVTQGFTHRDRNHPVDRARAAGGNAVTTTLQGSTGPGGSTQAFGQQILHPYLRCIGRTGVVHLDGIGNGSSGDHLGRIGVLGHDQIGAAHDLGLYRGGLMIIRRRID